jgi:CRISPR-associated RAMP protein (TIGR02581 family)
MSFDIFTSRVTIRGHLIAETGLHIGAGGSSLDPSVTDSPIIRDSAGRPFIPGSSLKGALRAHLESLARSLMRQDFWSCDPLIDPCIQPMTQNGKDGIEEIKDGAEKAALGKSERLDQVKYDQLLTDDIYRRSCTICKLFGSPWLASHVLIKDSFVLSELWGERVELRDGVGIDRDTETARHGVKYDFEVVPAMTGFDLEIVAENADEVLGLLSIGVLEMELGRVVLGGKTTRGLGSIKFIPVEIEIIGRDDLLNYLVSRKGRLLKGGAAHEYLNEQAKALANRLKARSDNNA